MTVLLGILLFLQYFLDGGYSKSYKSLALFCHEPKHLGELPLSDLL